MTRIYPFLLHGYVAWPCAEINGVIPAGASPLSGKLFMVLGAGGAGKSLAYGAAQKGARVVVANRTFGNALAMRFTTYIFQFSK